MSAEAPKPKDPPEEQVVQKLDALLRGVHSDIGRIQKLYNLSYAEAAALLSAFHAHNVHALTARMLEAEEAAFKELLKPQS